MSKQRVLSLASITLTIYNPYYDRISLGGGLPLGGGGKSMGTVSYSFQEDAFSMSTSADGGASVSHNKSDAGTIKITFAQTSPQIPDLIRFIRWCKENPHLAESTMTSRDLTGNITFQANGVFPVKIPDNTVTGTVGDREFEFIATEIIPEEEA